MCVGTRAARGLVPNAVLKMLFRREVRGTLSSRMRRTGKVVVDGDAEVHAHDIAALLTQPQRVSSQKVGDCCEKARRLVGILQLDAVAGRC